MFCFPPFLLQSGMRPLCPHLKFPRTRSCPLQPERLWTRGGSDVSVSVCPCECVRHVLWRRSQVHVNQSVSSVMIRCMLGVPMSPRGAAAAVSGGFSSHRVEPNWHFTSGVHLSLAVATWSCWRCTIREEFKARVRSIKGFLIYRSLLNCDDIVACLCVSCGKINVPPPPQGQFVWPLVSFLLHLLLRRVFFSQLHQLLFPDLLAH